MKKNTEKEELVFEFWNSFKGQETSTKLCSKTGTRIRWRSHNKLTHDMRLAIQENLKNYSVEDMCTAIDNYAETLLREDTFWTYIWPLSIFFTVKYEKTKDGRKKWWQWLPENYDIRRFLQRNTNTAQTEEIPDLNPDLTIKLTRSIQRWGIVRKGFTPSSKETNQLRLATQKMMDFYKDRSCKDEGIWLEDLYDCLNDNYLSKGDTVSIGMLCSKRTWNILMTQQLRQCGSY